MEFDDSLKQKFDTVSAWTDELLPKGGGWHSVIFDAVGYSVKNGGKRVRPILCASVCELLGGDIANAKHFACAIEYIHTYSLIHDDLPCMDNDDLRRGKPTNHKVFGEATAVLAGDALLTYAFQVAASSPVNAAQGVLLLAKKSGCDGMIGGQVIDMSVAQSAEQLFDLHRRKTGALICAAALLGALAANADQKSIDAVTAYAENLGLAFQIKDDILDVESTSEVLGKPVGSDIQQEKKTFVSYFGIDGAEDKLEYYTNAAKNAISVFGDRAEFLKAYADYLLGRSY